METNKFFKKVKSKDEVKVAEVVVKPKEEEKPKQEPRLPIIYEEDMWSPLDAKP